MGLECRHTRFSRFSRSQVEPGNALLNTDLVVVECKSRLSKDDVDEFVEKLTRFKIAFPHYKNYRA
jgi:hypothetical protein